MSLKYEPASPAVERMRKTLDSQGQILALASDIFSAKLLKTILVVQGGRCKATWRREFELPWREAGPPNHHDDKVDSDQ